MLLLPLAACDIGGGGGGGPAPHPLPLRPRFKRPPHISDPIARGKIHYRTLGCSLCHGKAGQGGVPNRNSETGGLINGLRKLRSSYTEKELAKLIREGVATVGKKDKGGPTPPLRMPSYAGRLVPQQMSDLTAYLVSLSPKTKRKDTWDEDDPDKDDDAEDAKSAKGAKGTTGAKGTKGAEGVKAKARKVKSSQAGGAAAKSPGALGKRPRRKGGE